MSAPGATAPVRIGVDIGGTFTDFVVYHPLSGAMETFKLLSTPDDPSRAVLQGIDRISRSLSLDGAQAELFSLEVIHGSTVATNALLERKGARTGFITTRGFRDLLRIGRQNRTGLYDLLADPPPPLVSEMDCFELDERVGSHGEVLKSLQMDQLEPLVEALNAQGITSVAVCFLFSFLHPEHEQAVASRLRDAGFFVSASSEILPEYREFERASTTAVNAYVSPVLEGYLSRLELALPAGGGARRLRVMQSNGGTISLQEARRNGVRCILSGPAGGVIGAHYVAQLEQTLPPVPTSGAEGSAGVITLDMGGTSTDVSLVAGGLQITTEAMVGGCPIRVPVLDIHTIGAGGGSIARVDAGGALKVGPESAGADPGPACYGRGDLPTVTDANLVLGRMAAETFLGGEMTLDIKRAQRALEDLGRELGLTARQAALGVVEIANAHMERALRVISVERGHDPRRFTLLSFGGAGGLHAADLARRLGIPRVLVPPLASTLSAFGMLAADVVKDYTQTVMLPGDAPAAQVAASLALLRARGREELLAEGIEPVNLSLDCSLDMRYLGQSYELAVPVDWRLAEGQHLSLQAALTDFHLQHQRAFGYQRPGSPVEIVNARVRAAGRITPPRLQPQLEGSRNPADALVEMRTLVTGNGALVETPVYRGEALLPGCRLEGPAVVVRPDTTILLGPSDRARVDAYANLIITVGE